MAANIEELTRSSFETLAAGSDRPVVVDFWGPRCRPCLALGPHFEALADRYGDRLKFLKAEAPANRMLCVDLRVTSLPTFLLLENGVEVDRLIGEINPKQLTAWVERAAERTAERRIEAHG